MKKIAFSVLIAFSMMACGSGGDSGAADSTDKKPEAGPDESVKLDQYMAAGQKLYAQYCTMCHQPEGTGLAEVYPPLANSDYMENNFEEVICILKNGKTGEITVNGKTYNSLMPEQPTLTDLDIAEIATYIYNSWGHSRGLIPVTEVTALLAECDEGE